MKYKYFYLILLLLIISCKTTEVKEKIYDSEITFSIITPYNNDTSSKTNSNQLQKEMIYEYLNGVNFKFTNNNKINYEINGELLSDSYKSTPIVSEIITINNMQYLHEKIQLKYNKPEINLSQIETKNIKINSTPESALLNIKTYAISKSLYKKNNHSNSLSISGKIYPINNLNIEIINNEININGEFIITQND